jgi:hypothetical protein
MTMKWRISCRSRYIALEMDLSTREVDDIRWNLERGVAAPLCAYPTQRRAYAPHSFRVANDPGLSRDAA